MEGLITAPTVLRAAYAYTAAATGSFAAVSAAAEATGAMARASSPLRRLTGELTRLTGPLPQLPGAPDRQESGLAALFAVASAAVASRWEHAERGDPDLADRRVPPAARRGHRTAEGGSRSCHVV